MTYFDKCSGCAISQGLRHPVGGIVKLRGDWIVNHYGGSEGFLGWLALQPRFHRMGLSELTDIELRSLGSNLKDLDWALTQYWHLQYPDDPVQRVYVVYFFESEFQTPPEKEPYHMHIHVIPRFQSLNTLDLLRRTNNGGVSWVDGWRTPTISLGNGHVPEAYQRQSSDWETRVTNVVNYIRHELADH